ncbi:MAG: copper resistance CopC family protein [Nocardioides sp.]
MLLGWSVAALWCLIGAQPAWAHATLVATTPSASSVLTAPPQQVLLEFTEPLERSSVTRVRDPEGVEHPSATLFSTSGEVLVVLPDPGGPDGTWSVDYRAVFQDGHALTGTLTYSVGRLTGDDGARPQVTSVGLFASLLLIATLGFGVTVRTLSVAGSEVET